ncbi:NTF2 domain-containing protein/RRM_6 domain-containing protein [Cephalotus follicularis]|uniref:NTF2 domain-containing protein/RRM_6 domain-containing protein n=1 Tax=Cephalotus follicularis TaxID=3775 RepID=A0A1Q3ALU9_CEPFO|nr:NTF2 domain-containing protein/RRM_6 domain-containing protein [Cephalotus follicularis]
MASSYPGPVQVGSYFVGQYYQVLQQQPDLVHQFYSDASSMIRVDGDSSESASTLLGIHTLVMSLNFTAIEIKTINSIDSWNGGVLVMVSGSVKTRDFSGRRKFVHTFFLAPQDKGYFVLNDMFQFIDDGMTNQSPAPVISEREIDVQISASSPLMEPPVSDYVLEEEAIEDDPVDKYSLPEQEQQEDPEAEIVIEETPVEESATSLRSVFNVVQEPPAAAMEESVGEPTKKTYASILRVSKEHSAPLPAMQPSPSKSVPSASDWNYISPAQQSISAASYATEYGTETTEEGLALDEGEPKSVYVRNLPSTITTAEIEQEFKNFGRIKPDGVFLRNRKDAIGVCYAFVEFEELVSVQNAIQASPIQLAGRQVYIEERRPNVSSTSRGGRLGRGRGRGSYQADAPRGRFGARSHGRPNNLDDGDDNRSKGNGFYQRGSW